MKRRFILLHSNKEQGHENCGVDIDAIKIQQNLGVCFSQPCHPWLPGIRKCAAISTAIIERTLSSTLSSRIGKEGRTRLIHYGLKLAGLEFAQQVHGHPTRRPRLFSHTSYTVTTGRLFHRSATKPGAKTTSCEAHPLMPILSAQQSWTITMTGDRRP